MGKTNRTPPPLLVQPDRLCKRSRTNASSCSDITDSIQIHSDIDFNYIKDALSNISSKYDILLSKFNDLSNEFLIVKKTNLSLVELIKQISNGSTSKDDSSQVPKQTFSSVLKTNSVVVVKPKNVDQKTAETIKDINNKLDPNCVSFQSVRGSTNGGIIIECSTKEQSEKLKNLAINNLGENYSINVPTGQYPIVRISGLLNKYDDETLVKMIRKDNADIFLSESMVKVVQTFHIKRSDSYGAKIQVDPHSFSKIMAGKNIRIGFEMCRVSEGFNIVRCYNCNGYDHISAKCTFDTSCAKCGEGHKMDKCSSDKIECINCKAAAKSLNLCIETNHVVWDESCRVFQEKVKLARRRTNYNCQ